mmetsp:Transcript_9922/g.27119  ORF Transcript_9922/g.27119 Transcript_9922/m.27119 type:complete len:226 (+) Transcript_9922:601-1278(+)
MLLQDVECHGASHGLAHQKRLDIWEELLDCLKVVRRDIVDKNIKVRNEGEMTIAPAMAFVGDHEHGDAALRQGRKKPELRVARILSVAVTMAHDRLDRHILGRDGGRVQQHASRVGPVALRDADVRWDLAQMVGNLVVLLEFVQQHAAARAFIVDAQGVRRQLPHEHRQDEQGWWPDGCQDVHEDADGKHGLRRDERRRIVRIIAGALCRCVARHLLGFGHLQRQ